MPLPPPAHRTPDDVPEHEETDPTPTKAPPRPSPAASSPPGRPPLLRSPPVRLAELPQPRNADPGAATPPGVTGPRVGAADERQQGHAVAARPPSGAEQERLAKLKDAVNAKLVSQARKRGSHNQKTVATIVEEGVAGSPGQLSPSVAAAFASPIEPPTRPLSTHSSSQSTASTESTPTIRASVPATPAEAKAVPTPSYPFPHVPGNPRTWSSGLHRPFTTLSPTVAAAQPADEIESSRKSSVVSGASTPAATATDFMPPGSTYREPEDPRYPTPNLYELVLSLNSEPGLDQWWTTVTNIMHDHFKAERVTIVMPLDPTDIENVPWGQKATFSMNGREEFVPPRTVHEQMSRMSRPDIALREPSTDGSREFQMQKLHPERLRPRLETRHSYAGHGREPHADAFEATNTFESRPAGPQRTVTHAAGIPGGVGPGRRLPQRAPSTTSLMHTSVTDPEFSSIAGGVDAGPYAEVFPTLFPLNHEVRPLIEAGGVNRVLERGRVVTVTRDYVSDKSDSAAGSNATDPTPGEDGGVAEKSPKTARTVGAAKSFGNYRSAFASDQPFGMRRDYEEYEQYPTSPWAQSPAPSPAIQADEETNPFFASEEQQVEESFNPASNTPKDYSIYNQVEAIGIEHASTVIHTPLVHPTLSQPMQSLRMQHSENRPGPPRRSNTLDLDRKAPIAILSLLSSTVPYPPNLTRTLKLLGPHLATSFSTAQQFSSSHLQTLTIRHRRTASGHHAVTNPMSVEPTSLEEIVNAELEGPPGSMSGSITSPSEYSGRSRHSPSGSIAGTPGWDPAAHGWTSSRSVAGTPAISGTEIVDNYFESKKRSNQRSGSNVSATVQPTPVKSVTKSSPVTGKEETKSPPSESKPRPGRAGKEDRLPLKQIPEREPSPPTTDSSSPSRPAVRHSLSHSLDKIAPDAVRRGHSLLHSYGADLESSFGSTFLGLGGDPQTPGTGSHSRKASYPEDMPPPSERLLRTIIDSVPVQIFTAQPDTGHLSWVNTKFLVYRAQVPRQVLGDPWSAIHPDDRTEFLASWNRSLRTAQQLQQKVRLERFDGSYRWFYVRAAPLRDKRQRIVHWIGTMMDFHEQHLAELNASRQQETAASEAKYRALANSSPQIVFAVNKVKGVTFCNSQWVHYSGQTEAQALGVGFMDHVHPDDLAKCRLPTFDGNTNLPKNVPMSVPPELERSRTTSANSSSDSSDQTERGSSSPESSPLASQPSQRKLSELASTGILKVTRDADGRPSYSTEVRLKSKDGGFRWHLVRVLVAEPLLQSVDEEETWYGTCTDINDHKTLERDLKETMDEKSRFLSNMSHEIRTPLNGIMGMVNFLIDSSLTPEQMEHVNIIRSSTEGLRGLINDILDLSKAEAGMIQLNIDWMYVRALIEEVNDLTFAMAIDKGLELNYIVEEDVPAQIKGDRFRIRQVLLNIIGNAIKFTERGEVFVRCSAMAANNGELGKNEMYIRFEIIDTGRGFTEKEAEHLFKRFSQIDGSSTRQHGGTGLGLVISRQLAQLHGGDMSAKAVAGRGSTFTFFIKTTLPSKHDQPPLPLPTPSASGITLLPMESPVTTSGAPTPMPQLPRVPSVQGQLQAKPSPKFLTETTASPSPQLSPDIGRESPSVSSASSDPSIRSAARTSSLRSERSSASSYAPDIAFQSASSMKLAMPFQSKRPGESSIADAVDSERSAAAIKPAQSPTDPALATPPPMYSILVICPLAHSRAATVQHIEGTLPKSIPHQITARAHFKECQEMLGGDDPVIFSHIVVVFQDVDEIVEVMKKILSTACHSSTSIVVITDLAQRRSIIDRAPSYDYDQLSNDRRLCFVFKPLKPSRFAVIFDPQKERETSTDRNQDSAQQLALTQKQVFEELGKKLGNTSKRVLLVEDNRVNQMVILKFLAKVNIPVETALDGVQCIDKVFSHPHGHYSVILCDLHMPNKDGYQTCKEVRKWEKKNRYPHSPIIALSANVLGDVYQKCVEAGFNSYMTKPVDFKELSAVLMAFMDPSDPSKPHELMKNKRRQSSAQR